MPKYGSSKAFEILMVASKMYVWIYGIVLTPRRVASSFERFSPITHTILFQCHFYQPVPVRSSGLGLVARHLELALDKQR